MSAFAPTRFVDGAPMLLAGVRRTHRFADLARGIPQQWQDFRALGDLPGGIGTIRYGAICGAAANQLEYLCAMEVSDLAALPATLGKMRVQAEHYAVFEHRGAIADIGASWARIWNEWLPASAWVSAQRPDFERYDERYDAARGTGLVEIWVAVRPGV